VTWCVDFLSVILIHIMWSGSGTSCHFRDCAVQGRLARLSSFSDNRCRNCLYIHTIFSTEFCLFLTASRLAIKAGCSKQQSWVLAVCCDQPEVYENPLFMAALDSVTGGLLTISQAADKFGVRESTLKAAVSWSDALPTSSSVVGSIIESKVVVICYSDLPYNCDYVLTILGSLFSQCCSHNLSLSLSPPLSDFCLPLMVLLFGWPCHSSGTVKPLILDCP